MILQWYNIYKEATPCISKVDTLSVSNTTSQINYYQAKIFDIVKSFNKKLNYRPQKNNTSSFGLESFRWLGPKIWELVPDNVKHAKSHSAFKSALRKRNIDNCPCKLYKDYCKWCRLHKLKLSHRLVLLLTFSYRFLVICI